MNTFDELHAEYEVWRLKHGLPDYLPTDLPGEEALTAEQTAWLESFNERVAAADAAEEAAAGDLVVGLRRALNGSMVKWVEKTGEDAVTLWLEGDDIQRVMIRAAGGRLMVELDGEPVVAPAST